jgi:ABC-type branched-subunit amino acid transport system substrate-binding protein
MSVIHTTTKDRSGSLTIRNFLFVLLLLLAAFPSIAQDSKNLERVVIGDLRFILHTVQKNETLYSISRQYECTQEEVLASNRNISGVIKKGMVLKIPDHTYQKPLAAKIDESKFIRHLVVSGDNYYQLKLKYGVDEEELLKYNPDLKEGLKTGKTILVPGKPKAEVTAKEAPANAPASQPPQVAAKPRGADKTLEVGLYLPISASVADSLKPSARSLSFLAFYQGALIAVDRLAKTGLKAKLYVYDTEKPASTIQTLVKKPEFLSLDLLIGPVYPELQKVVSELSAKNRIPMVSPLSADDKYAKTNPFYFQVNPVRKLRMEATADYLTKEFAKEKIIFLATENGSAETKGILEELTRKNAPRGGAKGLLRTYNIWSNGIDGLESQLQADKQNILVMAEMNEVNVSIAMNRLALLSKKYPLILVGIQEFTRMQSIEIENLHNVNLRFLSTYFVDYKLPSVTTFVENFKAEFGTEPSLFAFQGYDITTCFLKSLQKSADLSHGFPANSNTGLLQASYHFTKVSDFGGFTNDSFTVVEYANTFDVRSVGVVRRGE